MSIAERYGETEPEMVSVEPDANKVCVKTTSHILKKHIHLSPSIKVDTSLTTPTISSNAGNAKRLETLQKAVFTPLRN